MTAADHANTVRDALREHVPDGYDQVEPGWPGPLRREALAALDALQAKAETAERWRRACEVADAFAKAAEAERDAAVRQRDQAHDALRGFAEGKHTDREGMKIARTALSAREEAWTHEDRMVLGDGGC